MTNNFNLLNLEAIKNWLGELTVQEGSKLYQQKCVLELKSQFEVKNEFQYYPDDSLVVNVVKVSIQSKLLLSNGSRYTCKIEIVEFLTDGQLKLNFSSWCECMHTSKCKHAAATLLGFLDSDEYKSRCGPNEHLDEVVGKIHLDTFKKWVSSFRQSQKPRPPSPNPKNEFIVYILKDTCRYGGEPILDLEVLVTKHLASGDIGKGKRFKLFDNNMYLETILSHSYLNEEDLVILRHLGTYYASGSFGERKISLKGQTGCIVIEQMAKSKRLFWEGKLSQSLEWGAERELTNSWQADKKGNYKLIFEAAGAKIFQDSDPMLYVDFQKSIVGKINTLLEAKTVHYLNTMKPIPSRMLDAFSREIAISLPEITPPKNIKTNTISNVKPIPHLYFCAHLDPLGDVLFYQLKLKFKYDNYLIPFYPALPVTTLSVDEGFVEIQRDRVAENRAIDFLKTQSYSVFNDCGASDEKNLLFRVLPAIGLLSAMQIWKTFIENHVEKLKTKGWQIIFENEYELSFEDVDSWDAEIEMQQSDWFSLSFDTMINGKKVKLMPLIVEALKQYDLKNLPEKLLLPLSGSRFVAVPSHLIKPTIEILYELFDSPFKTNGGSIKLRRHDASRLSDLDQLGNINWKGAKEFLALGKKLKDFKGINNITLPANFNATLRDYQVLGVNWLQFMREYEFNGILADDMGLGKTIQTLAHLLIEKQSLRAKLPTLLIAPTTLMSNWKNEAKKFAPDLKVLVLHGSLRGQHFESLDEYDLILTTYPLLIRDEKILCDKKFHYLILDEAQAIKNAKTKAANVLRKLSAKHKLCLTGTPMENHLGELWSLFDFLMPGFLGSSIDFGLNFRTPIEKNNSILRRQQLARKVLPFMLRRTKNQVALELPAKTEIVRTVQFGTAQATLYEGIRLAMEKKIQKEIASKGLSRSHIVILDAILKLRQTCCDPRLLNLEPAKAIKESAKLELLMEIVPELLEEGRKILLFSQFTSMLALIEVALIEKGIAYSKLTGETLHRETVIDEFKSGATNIFLISLKAGGVGLNLTEADTVIHYDPWWNPAVENQATDRVHRIGQDKPVFVYKLIVENTLEEKIIAMQEKKGAIAAGIYSNAAGEQTIAITAQDIQDLFAPQS